LRVDENVLEESGTDAAVGHDAANDRSMNAMELEHRHEAKLLQYGKVRNCMADFV